MNLTLQAKDLGGLPSSLPATTAQSRGSSSGTEGASAPREAPDGGFPRGDAFQLPTFSMAAQIRVVATVVLLLSSACANIAMLCSIRQKFQRKPHLRILLTNLAAADLLVTFVVMPLDAVWNVTLQWYAGDLACRLLMFLKLGAMYASSFVTVVISLDRRAAILHPLSIGRAKWRNKVMLSVAWALSFILAVPQIFVFHTVSRSRPTHFTQCATLGSFPARWQETLYNMLTFSFLFLLPLLSMLLCYSCIFREISRKMTPGRVSPQSREVYLRCSRNNIPQARVRTLKMSAATVLTFVVCWTPYYLLGLWSWFSPEMLTQEVPSALSHAVFLFGLFNTCLDPLIYCFFSTRFQSGCRPSSCCTGPKREATAPSGHTPSCRASTTEPRETWLSKAGPAAAGNKEPASLRKNGVESSVGKEGFLQVS